MKLLKLSTTLSLLSVSAYAAGILSGQSYIYKDPRIMGMGGANIAVGGYSSSIFHNPAGLSSIKKSDGLVVEVPLIGVEASNGFYEAGNEASSLDTNDIPGINDFANKYAGQIFSEDITIYNAVSKHSDFLAWSVGFLISEHAAFVPHTAVGPTSSIISLQTGAELDFFGGVSHTFENLGIPEIINGNLDVGLSTNLKSRYSADGDLTASQALDFLNSNSDSIINDTLAKFTSENMNLSFDLGVNYRMPEVFLRPSVGLSIMGIGNISMDPFINPNSYLVDSNISLPVRESAANPNLTTVNIGAAISPEVKYIESLIVAIDYVDIFNANQIYFLNSDGTLKGANDSNFFKHLRMGASLGLIDNMWIGTDLNLGLYQGSYTAGLHIRLTAIDINLATYAEEHGPNPFDEDLSNSDRRYMARVGFVF